MKRGFAAALVPLALLTATTRADNDIVVVVDRGDGNPTTYFRPADTDWTLNNGLAVPLGTVDTVVTVQVYDGTRSNGLPDQSIGLVTFQGAWSTGGEVRLLIADPIDSWPRPIDPMQLPGVVNLGFMDGTTVHGGFDFRDESGDPNPDLQKHTRLAAFTYDDIYGDYTVGQIQRVQAGFRPEGGIPNPGTIYGHLTALTLDGTFDNPTSLVPSVGLVFAGNGVAGVIEAAGNPATFDPHNDLTYASIAGVIIGVPENPVAGPQRLGVTGDVLAQYGAIGVVYSNGPIGTPQRNSIIRAGNGIGEVRALASEAGGGSADPRVDMDKAADFHVDLDAAWLNVETGDPWLDGVLARVDTFGDIYGTIHAGNLICAGGGIGGRRPGLGPTCTRTGIFAGGNIRAPITVDFTVVEGAIIGRTIQIPVEVGWQLCGAVVAWDVDDASPANRIPSIRVGWAEDAPGGPTSPYMRYQIGGHMAGFVGAFGGGGSAAFANVRDSASFLSQMQNRPWQDWDWVCEMYTRWGSEDNTPPLIAARSVGTLSLKRVTCWELADNGIVGVAQTDIPEGVMPVILVEDVDSLQVDYFQDGAVWSGRFDGSAPFPVFPTPDVNTNRADDYTAGRLVALGCVGPGAHLFLEGSDALNISGSMAGEVFMPDLPEGSLFRVAHHFASQVDGVQVCSNEDAGLPGSTFPANYPALPRFLNPVDRSSINVAQGPQGAGSLKGQVILNANNNAPATPGLWDGQVIAMPTPGGSTPVPAVLATDRTAPEEHAPLYTHFSGPHDAMMRDHCTDPEWFPTPITLDGCKMPSLGGGAVGLVPFAMDEADCNPRHDWLWNRAEPNKLEHWPVAANQPVLNWGFGLGYQHVTIRFYGPVRTEAPANAQTREQPVTIWYFVDYGQGGQWRSDFTKFTTITMKRPNDTGLSREVVIKGNASQSFPPGYYAVQFHTAPRDVANGQPHYPIYCDGLFDQQLRVPPLDNYSNAQGSALYYYFYLWPDCDHDAVIDPTESACGGTFCAADLDDGSMTGTPDGGVDINDLLYFLAMYEVGDTAVDLDNGSGTGYPDGGVDINDLLFFLTHYEGGC